MDLLSVPEPMDFQLTTDGYLWRILKNFIGGCLPSYLLPLLHRDTNSHIYLPGLWELGSYYCLWPHPHSPFFSQKSCCLFAAVTAQPWDTRNYLPLCCHQQLTSTASVGTSLRPLLCWQLLLPLGALLMSTRFLFTSLLFFFPIFPIFSGSWLLLRKNWSL